MKRFIGLVVASLLLLGAGAQPAGAHTEAQLRWEGAAIALGTIGAIVVLSDALEVRSVSVAVGDSTPGCNAPRHCSPPPPPRPWVPGHWEEVQVWVSASRDDDGCSGRWEGHRGHGNRGRHGHDRCGPRGHGAGARGHYEKRRVWRDGCYR